MSSRVPTTIGPFNDYIINADNRLQATNPDTNNPYSQDYGISDTVATDWANRRINWVKNIYPAYSNPATSTSIAKDDTHSFINDFRGFAASVLNKIEASDVAGNAEEHIFNFVLHRKNPSHPLRLLAASASPTCTAWAGGYTKLPAAAHMMPAAPAKCMAQTACSLPTPS